MKYTVLLAVLALATVARAAYVDIVPTELRHYKVNEKITFRVAVYHKPGELMKAGKLYLTARENNLRKLSKPLEIDLAKQNDFTYSVSLNRPGFVQLEVSNIIMPDCKKIKIARNPLDRFGGAAVEPEKIQAAMSRPADFDQFWAEGLEEFKKAQVIVTPQDKLVHQAYDVLNIEVKFPAGRGSIYGTLSIPKDRSRQYPAEIWVPGAGPGIAGSRLMPHSNTQVPVIKVRMNVHKFPAGKDAAEQKKLLRQYNKSLPEKSYLAAGCTDRNKYFFRDVWLALSKVVDHVTTLKEFDGKNFMATGSSQGGFCSLAVAYLNKKISCVFANVPGLCDNGGWMLERDCCWSFISRKKTMQIANTMAYFDCVNFASRITVPTHICVGFVDTTCPPAGVYAMYNALAGKKKIYDMHRLGHKIPPEMNKLISDFYKEVFIK